MLDLPVFRHLRTTANSSSCTCQTKSCSSSSASSPTTRWPSCASCSEDSTKFVKLVSTKAWRSSWQPVQGFGATSSWSRRSVSQSVKTILWMDTRKLQTVLESSESGFVRVWALIQLKFTEDGGIIQWGWMITNLVHVLLWIRQVSEYELFYFCLKFGLGMLDFSKIAVIFSDA